jgi:hypothetical protein
MRYSVAMRRALGFASCFLLCVCGGRAVGDGSSAAPTPDGGDAQSPASTTPCMPIGEAGWLLQYVAGARSDGRVVVLLMSTSDDRGDRGTPRLFLGMPTDVRERRVLMNGTQCSLSGGCNYIYTFDDDGEDDPFEYSNVLGIDGSAPPVPYSDGWLARANGAVTTFEVRWPLPASLPDLSFTCL